ncbi:hypothetical protein BSSX_p0102 (plasmid) [Bacillus subtilis]|nr:hypothetical protein BSSX_p0102 [Bacillus subtilis]
MFKFLDNRKSVNLLFRNFLNDSSQNYERNHLKVYKAIQDTKRKRVQRSQVIYL